MHAGYRIPTERRERFDKIAKQLKTFGQEHLDEELTSFTLELWARICRRKAPDCLRGTPEVWAATVIHIISRMNFLHDRSQPIYLAFDTTCDAFGVSKKTIGAKATEIERMLKLRQSAEPGLCRADQLETFTNLQLSNGMIVSWKDAKQMGIIPPDAKIEDFR